MVHLLPNLALQPKVIAKSLVLQTAISGSPQTLSLNALDKFFMLYEGGTLSRLISKQMHVGLAPPSKLVGQSRSGMATTWVVFTSMPLEDVCTAAGWTSSSTFTHFYKVKSGFICSPLVCSHLAVDII